MKAFLAMFTYLVMAAVLGLGILTAVVKGSFWLLGIGFLAFILIMTRVAIMPRSH